MSDSILEIYKTGQHQINLFFLRSNKFILEKYHTEFKEKTLTERIELLEYFWKIEFDAELCRDPNFISKYRTWNSIKFANHNKMILFALRWS